MFQAMLALALTFPSFALANGPFAINYGTYRIIARHSNLSPEEDFSRGVTFLQIYEQGSGNQRAIIMKYLDAKKELRGGGPILTTAEITGDPSLRCEERARLVYCTDAKGWFSHVISRLSRGRYVLSSFNGGDWNPETTWELVRE
jgi:hypothetical protein